MSETMVVTNDVDRLIAWLDATEAHHETDNWDTPLPPGAAALVKRMRDHMASEARSLMDAANEVSGLAADVMYDAGERLLGASRGSAP
jgi:hypothetical protein